MTLKEKFKNCKNKRNTYYIVPIIEDVEQLEIIADEYAIDFAEWLIKRQMKYFESLKELLEIFKKEKGL